MNSTRLQLLASTGVLLFAVPSVLDARGEETSPGSDAPVWDVLPGSGSPGWDWRAVQPCETFTCDVITDNVWSPIRMRVIRELKKLGPTQDIRNCSSEEISKITYDLTYETTHSWGVGLGITAGAKGSVESGLLAKAIVEGKAEVSVSGRVDGEMSRINTFTHGIEVCMEPLPPCFSVQVRTQYDDYEATLQQDLGFITNSVIFSDDGSVIVSDPCFFAVETMSATADGDIAHVFSVHDGPRCTEEHCKETQDPGDSGTDHSDRAPDSSSNWGKKLVLSSVCVNHSDESGAGG